MSTITAELSAGTIVRISDGRHDWTADEPLDHAGTDTGPSPYELLLASLAACTCTTLALYCRHKGIALTSVRASYHHEKVAHADTTDQQAPRQVMVDRITSQIRISGVFDDAQRKRLAEVATRCPVHRTLEGGTVVVDEVEVG